MFVLILILTYVLPLCRGFDIVNRDFLLPENESEVLAIDSNYGSLAVATRENIFIYSQDTHRSTNYGNQIRLPFNVSKTPGYIELKLLSKQQVFYCDQFSCRVCTWSHQNSSCSHLSLDFSQSKKLTTAAVARVGEKIVLRAVDTNDKAAIITYDVQDSGDTRPDQIAHDTGFIKNQHVLLGFERHRFAFFVGSSYQPYEPAINSGHGIENRSIVKVSRVCGNDKTPELESRIDLALSCPGADETSIAVAAHYEPSLEQLVLMFQDSNNNQTVCKFDMAKVDEEINRTWDICQQIDLMDASRDCEYRDQNEPITNMKDHCFVFSRKADSMRSCVRFGLGSGDEIYKNCELHRKTSNSYRYGWLENFKPFVGDPIGRLRIPSRREYGLYPDNRNRAIFVVIPDETTDNVLRIRMDPGETPLTKSPIVWQTTSFPRNSRSIATSSANDALYITNKTKVSTVFISCSDFYKTCDSIADGGWQDPMSCVWCPDEGNTQVISSYDKFNCRQPLSRVCPPVLDHANRDQNHSEWQIFGTNLRRLKDSTVYVCNQPCTVNPSLSSDLKLHCFLADGSEQDASCEVRVAGRLGDYNAFSIRANKVTNSVGVGTEVSEQASTNPGKSSSKTWKAILAVVVVVLILGALVVIIWFARKHMLKRAEKNNEDNGSRVGFTLSPHTVLPTTDRRRNSYVGVESLRMDSMNMYDRIFRNIDDAVKIPIDSLSLENQIGKGHFGVVNRATYTSPDGTQKKVACKMIKDNVAGVREFLAEGLVMAQFEHPRLLQLIGIALSEEHTPIIVTDFMVNGDLVTYLRNKENSPTLRTLLTFAIEIAQGMEYLHSKNFIHRDLAARNCMLDNVLRIKIADFGLCRQCNGNNEYQPSVKNRDLPLRWMPIEALAEELFTFQGDIWAYGVVLWELMTRGMIPYGNKSGIALLDSLKRGERLEIPPYCPVQLYENIMLPCWNDDPQDRPSFTDLVFLVEDLVASMERSQNTQLYSHYERVSTTTPTAHNSSSNTGSGGFGAGLR